MTQREIQKKIDLGEIVTMDMETGLVKGPTTGYFIGFRFNKPYNKISHGYSMETAENIIAVSKMNRLYKKELENLYR